MSFFEQAVKAGKEYPCTAARAQKHLVLSQPLRLVAFLRAGISSRASSHRDFVQVDILESCPNDGEATGLGREDIDLIGPLPHILEAL